MTLIIGITSPKGGVLLGADSVVRAAMKDVGPPWQLVGLRMDGVQPQEREQF